ncbi:DNA alkylation repair protein [uncultured Bacteroides sp.]|uniref:DNA alkylation repair protein n=1 Tax=uncultured Bacteroides sp. TaxID=162156 RepID=UPI0026002C2A|nr:DNA alkylation repair protein [uncultured Bacteroides sp.]
MVTTENIREELQALADTKYREFHASLIPGANNILGVRIPQLRTMAKELTKKEGWRTFVETADTTYYEETMLQGMIIGLAKMELEERLTYITMFVPRIKNWAVCDIFCGELKTAVRKGKETVWQFIQPYLKSPEEFKIRFGIVMLFHFVDEGHIDSLLAYADSFEHEAYYARMAMAWMTSICFVKFPEKTMEYLKRSKLDSWTYNKALQKTIESLRVDKDTKDILRNMKRR